MSRLSSVNLRLSLQNGTAAELFRIPIRVDDSVIHKDDSRSDVGCDRIRRRAHFEATVRRTDNRVDAEFGIDVGLEVERAVNADRLEFLWDDRVDRQRHALRNDNPGSVSWQNAVLPDRRVGPVAGDDNCIRCLVRRDKSHRRRMDVLSMIVVLAPAILTTMINVTMSVAHRHGSNRGAGQQGSNLQQLSRVTDRFATGFSSASRASVFQVAQPVKSQHDQLPDRPLVDVTARHNDSPLSGESEKQNCLSLGVVRSFLILTPFFE